MLSIIMNNIYLINEFRWEKNNKKVLKFLSGLIEENEMPKSTVKREILEEVGVRDVKVKKLFTYVKQGTINQRRYYYVAYINNTKELDLSILCKFSKKRIRI